MARKSPRNPNVHGDIGEPDQDFKAADEEGLLHGSEAMERAGALAGDEDPSAHGKAIPPHNEPYWSRGNEGDAHDLGQAIPSQ